MKSRGIHNLTFDLMKIGYIRTGIIFILGFCLSFFSLGQSAKDQLTQDLDRLSESTSIPGFAVALVDQEKTLYQHGFGFANVEARLAFTESTVINIGSITKTFIAVALMKLVDEGKIGLDDPINKYLPFKVRHPRFPSDEIRIRHLATHTSGLTDGKNEMLIEKSYLFEGDIDFPSKELPKDYRKYFDIYRENEVLPMEEFLMNAYSEKGAWYSKHNFGKARPGTEYRYTNIGATLLALIIEKSSAMTFDEFVKAEILSPLDMESSFWKLEDIPEGRLSEHYLSNGLRIPPYELITYPDGGLFTSVSDFSSYLIDMIRGLNGKGSLLSPESYREMMSNQLTPENFPQGEFATFKGYMWSVNEEGDNVTMNGADPGVVTYTLFTTAGNAGFVIFLNTNLFGNDELEKEFNGIRAVIFKHFGAILKER